MAKISIEDLTDYTAGGGTRPSFFSLKNDGDFAICRVMHETPADFDIIVTHEVMVNNKRRKVSCLRTPKEPLTNCPLCAHGEAVQVRNFIHLLEYTEDENGNLVAEPKVFERSRKWVERMTDLADEYKPLHKYVFKLKRIGKAGEQSTDYSFNLQPNATTELYPYYEEDLEYSSALGTIVAEKSPEELNYYLKSGNFPGAQTASNQNRPVDNEVTTRDSYEDNMPRRRSTSNYTTAVAPPPRRV